MTELAAAYSERFDRALAYAADAHRRQVRKGTAIPYISHLLAVTALVWEAGGTEDQAIAALLHDAAEDVDGDRTLAEIRTRFGDHVADMVAALSDTVTRPKPPWRERKERYLQALDREPPEILLVSLADKVHNAESIRADYATEGEALWNRFSTRNGEDQLWYYASLAEVFHRRLPGTLSERLNRIVAGITAQRADNISAICA